MSDLKVLDWIRVCGLMGTLMDGLLGDGQRSSLFPEHRWVAIHQVRKGTQVLLVQKRNGDFWL